MQIKHMKGLSFLLATVSCISLMGGTNVFADTQAMKVSAKRVSEYSVTIPPTLSLTTTDNQNFTGTYTVGVKGDVDANDSVYLRPQNASFEMVGKADSNNKSTASVTQTKTEWSGSEIDSSSFTETAGDVEVEITHADEYEGDLVFEYGVILAHTENYSPGFYDAKGNLIASWEESGVELCDFVDFTGFDYSPEGEALFGAPSNHVWTFLDANPTTTKVIIPDSITSIGIYAFWSCGPRELEVIIPNSVVTIGDCAFSECWFDTITIPDSVTSIGAGAFTRNYSLTDVIIGNGVTTIGSGAFEGCSRLASVTYKGETYTSRSALESALVSNGVSVGDGAFIYTGLSE